MAIIKIPKYSKTVTMEPKGNYLENYLADDTAAKQEALIKLFRPENVPRSLLNQSKTVFYSSNRQLQKRKRYGNKKRGEIFNSNKQVWLGPNQIPTLPIGAQLSILQHVHELTHWGPEKMTSWRNNITTTFSYCSG